MQNFKFTEENIRAVFGAYDGEGENIERLKEYYFKNNTYESLLSELPIRILVGQKGIGKSAMFRVAMSELKESGHLPILIKPDDVAEIGQKHETLIISIRKWKFGLTDVIAKKVLQEFGLEDEKLTARIIKLGGKIIPLIKESIEKKQPFEELGQDSIERIEEFLENQRIVIFIDDLDRGWQNRSEGLIMISALINSIRDISIENPGLLFKLALRSDVFNAVRTSDESSDKYVGSVLWHKYELHEIFVMLVMRILTFQDKSVNEENLMRTSQKHLSHYLDIFFERIFEGDGKWENAPMFRILLSLIRNRPRDLVKLCTLAAREAYSRKALKISTSHIKSILPEYSESIINDCIAEYKSELPQIERLIYGMKPTSRKKTTSLSYSFTTAELRTKLFNISQGGRFVFASQKIAKPSDLIEFLFKINFITARKTLDDGTIERKNYEENSKISISYVEYGYDWEIHLAYRWVLQSDKLDDVFRKIKL